MIAKPKKRIAAYFRRSTKDKSQENSIERQQRALEHWLNSNSSEYELAGDAVFIEDGVSGDDSVNRPAFNRMLDLVKTGSCPFDSIFVSAVDRYGRFNALRCESYIYPLVENEIELVTPEKTYQWNEQGTGLHYLIFSSFSHQDNENRSAKSVQGIASKIANCTMVLKPPFGMKKKEDVVGLEPDENAHIIRKIFNMYVEFRSGAKVTAELNRAGIKSPSGGAWQTNSVVYILKNGKYAGFYEHGRRRQGKFFYIDADGQAKKRPAKQKGKAEQVSNLSKKEYRPDLIEPVVTKLQYEQVQLIMQGNWKPYGSPKGRQKYSGLVRCSHCGSKMLSRKRACDGKRTYSCRRGKIGGCNQNEIKEEVLDNQTTNILQRFILSSDSLPLLIGELSSIGTRQAEQKKELDELLNRYREGQKRLTNFSSHLSAEFHKSLEALSNEIQTKQRELEYEPAQSAIQSEAERLQEHIQDGYQRFCKDEELSGDFLQNYVSEISIEFLHVQRGKLMRCIPKSFKIALKLPQSGVITSIPSHDVLLTLQFDIDSKWQYALQLKEGEALYHLNHSDEA